MKAEISEILFLIIFIIISIISSVVNNKKKQQEKNNAQRRPVPDPGQKPDRQRSAQDRQIDLADIFESFLSGEKIEKEAVETGILRTKAEIIKDGENQRRRAEEMKRQYDREHTWQNYSDNSSQEKIKADKIVIKNVMPSSMESGVNKKASNLRKKLFNPESLKDYILISEIIGKPKALRR